MLAGLITKVIDYVYDRVPVVRSNMPLRLFRYAACGGGNVALSVFIIFIFHNFVFCEKVVHLGFIAMSSYVAAQAIAFVTIQFTGFWLQKNVTFQELPFENWKRFSRYILVSTGVWFLNYALLKLFVEVFKMYPTPSQMIISTLTIGFSYFFQRHFTFRISEKPSKK